MTAADLALLGSGGLILCGIAYPQYARSQRGWKIGAWAGSTGWVIWYGIGALAYFAGMWSTFGLLGIVGSIPLAFLLGFTLTIAARQSSQLIAIIGPILANVWFVAH